MPDQATQNMGKPRSSQSRRKKLAIGLLLVLGVGIVGWGIYTLSPTVRIVVVRALGWIGPSATPLVVDMSQDDSFFVHKAAIDVLLARKQDAVPALEKALSHPDAQRRKYAAEMLGYVGPAAAPSLPALAELGGKDQDIEVRKAAILAMGQACADDPKTVQVLIGLIEDPRPEIRSTVTRSLAEGGPKFKGAMGALIKAMKDNDITVRGGAVVALRRMDLEAMPAVPALIEALQDPHIPVQWQAREALKDIFRQLRKQLAPVSPQGALAIHPDVN
jgi:HEAT repeat protein